MTEPRIGTREWAEARSAEHGGSVDTWLRRARAWRAAAITQVTEEIRQELARKEAADE